MPSERVQRRIDRLLDRADEAIEDEDWQRALESARAALGFDSENADAKAFVQAATEALDAAGIEPESSSESPAVSESTAPDDQPSSFANGRYQVTGFLGEGGKKKVYLVHDTTLDRDVAFALIKAEGLDDASRQRVTREAQAMARLGDNPNIMPIFDL
ncbi:MAG: hypothetical protein IH961_07875, partial [Chloroflexi bacterium]|nr:hypothetical protein [Chloroflexota bacterium]